MHLGEGKMFLAWVVMKAEKSLKMHCGERQLNSRENTK